MEEGRKREKVNSIQRREVKGRKGIESRKEDGMGRIWGWMSEGGGRGKGEEIVRGKEDGRKACRKGARAVEKEKEREKEVEEINNALSI